MYKRVLRTMIILCWVFLVAFVFLKTIPALSCKFVASINNENIVKIGQFIDGRAWLQQIVFGFTTLLTYQFYLCACIHKWHLSVKQYIVLCIVIAATNTLKYYVPSISLIVNVLIMVVYPFALKSDYRTFIIIFVTHYIGQVILGYVRSEPLNEVSYNTISALVLCADIYVWLLLYYLYSNLYKGEKFMGNVSPPIFDRMSKQIKDEITRLDNKIENCNDEKKLADYKERKAEYEKMLAETSDEK